MTDTKISALAAQAEAQAIARLFDYGYIEIRSGEQPASVDDAPEGDVLARLRFRSPAASVENGLITFRPIDPEERSPRSGRAGWFRAYNAQREALWDGSVGLDEGATLRMPSTLIRQGGRVVVLGATYRIERE